ncbi:MAG: hypothetical protein IKY94_08170 [Lachnospiraceae bacterium]|nr:hypothetical protein [Lachnospiraceae bacterium]
MAKAVKKTTKAVTPVAETKVEAVVEVKEEVKATPVAEVKEEAKKAPAKKATTKKAVAKEEVKAEATAKKAATKKTALKANVTLQFAEKSYTEESLVTIAKDVWTYDLNQKEADLKTVELYVKPEEGLCYYVFNGDVTGSFVI